MSKKTIFQRLRIKIFDAFDFSKAEQRGIIVLIVVLLLLLFFRFVISYIQNTGISVVTEDAEIEFFLQRQQNYRDSILSIRNQKYNPINNSYYRKEETKKKTLTPFPFDPNTLPFSGWRKLGFTEKQALQITNYQSKGGYFYEKTDLKKIYCITEDDYHILEKYIQIASKQRHETKKEKPDFQNIPKLELNTTDSFDLQRIPGIGQKTASQIVKYGEILGGYVHINQLREVYVIDSSRFLQISPYLYIEPQHVKKININKATINELSRHPYIDYYLAKSIIIYRQKNGDYTDIKEIKKALHLYEELYQKISPYLSVD